MIGLLQKLERGIDAILQPVVVLGMLALIGVITLQIISRVFFNAVPWTEEIARFLLIWITFLGAALAFQRGRHIAVTFVVDTLPLGIKKVARILACLIIIGFMLSLVIIGYEYMQVQSFQKSPSLRWSMYYVYAIMPISAALMLFYALIDLLELVTNRVPAPTAEPPI
ncbi:TRAP transporter small permease [Nitrincola alkalilacustris]|uniref:TRAP transporter small permease n=1 Tax=Nitrincola alkalilacustris TaxID=1571224 RepID=UPI001F0D2ABE|nr:TRAP transporter small permease [Nitrincola alkalilacustris]